MIDKISLFFWGISVGMIIVWIISANLECRNSLPKKKRGDEIVTKYEGSWYRIGEEVELKKVLNKKEVKMHYILKGHKIVEEPDLLKWAKWFETENKRVALTIRGNIRISTIFLGLNHNYGNGKPILFETMVFGGKFDQEQIRYHTWQEAKTGHKLMVAKVKKRRKMKWQS